MTDLLDGVFPDDDPSTRVEDAKATVEERRELLREWSRDPWKFLTGRDTNGKAIILTKDEGDADHPYKPFPAKQHLFRLTRDLFGEQKVVLVDKSRQLMISTLCCLLILHHILFRKGRACFVSKQKKELAEMLLRDKLVGPYERLPEWVRLALPLEITKSQMIATRTDSRVNAVAQNAAVGEFRGNRASIVMIDEAAFQEQFPLMVGAAREMCDRMWAVTTANSGNPGAERFLELAREE